MSSASSLASRASRGAVVTLAGQGGRVLVQLASVVILARLLSPQDYGLIAEVLLVVGIGEIVRDFGLTNASVQAKTLSAEERSNLFWLNSAIGSVLGVVAVVASPLVALLFDDQRLVPLTSLMAVVFVLNGVSTQLRADLNRSLRFGWLSSAELGGQGVALVGGVIAALLGAGYWALAVQQLVQALVTLGMLWGVTRFRPQRYHRTVPMRRFVGFGLEVVGAQLLGYASKNTDTLVIGTTIGLGSLGFYNRAFQILGLPLAQINAPSTRVALSVLSRLQDDAVRYRRYLLAGQTVMLHLVLAVFSWSASLASPLLITVLGAKWEPSVLLFQILAVSGVFSTAGYTAYWIFVSKGLTRSQLWWQVVSRPVLIGIIVLGSRWGVVGVASAYSIGSVVMWVLGLFWIKRAADAPAMAMFLNVVRALVGYGLPAGAAYTAAMLVPSLGMQLAVGTLAWVVVLVAIIAAWPRFRRDVLIAVDVARSLRGGRSGEAAVEATAETV